MPGPEAVFLAVRARVGRVWREVGGDSVDMRVAVGWDSDPDTDSDEE